MVHSGQLIGQPFMASVDRSGTRSDKVNCVYIVCDYKVPAGYAAYIIGKDFPAEYAHNLSTYCPQASVLYGVEDLSVFDDYDVIEVNSAGAYSIVYQNCSSDNVLFITNKCNSNCIMCPDSDASRCKEMPNRKDFLDRLIDLIPSDTNHLTITGGEPTLLKWDFIDILTQCKNKFPCTEFLMLSNARSLANAEYRESFLNAVPQRFRLAVPIYGVDAATHDTITRAQGSFEQTLWALQNIGNRIELEIRIVVMRKTYQELPNIAKFLAEQLPFISTVSIMGIELMGNAAIGRNLLWVDYPDTVPYIKQAIQILLHAGIDAKIYNYPLCNLPRSLWSMTPRSITGYKIRYKDECNHCIVKEMCGGFFFSTLHFEDITVYPIQEV